MSPRSINKKQTFFFHASYFFLIFIQFYCSLFLPCSITSSPKTARKLATTGIGHHINPLHNPYPNKPNQPTEKSSGMPQYGGGVEKCARCSKSVYLAEKRVGAGRVSILINYIKINSCRFF